MTRKHSYFGSLAKIFKRTVVVGLLLCSSEKMLVSAEESNYKMRLHKDFIRTLIDNNFPLVLNHIQNKVERNVFLTEINANIDDLSLEIKPSSGTWEGLSTEMFFD